MTWQLAAEDAVLYVFLIAAAGLYGAVLAHNLRNRPLTTAVHNSMRSGRAALRFRQYSILLVSGWMVIGVLYQCRALPWPVATVLFVFSGAISGLGLIRLRRYIK